MMRELKIFSGQSNPALAESICDYLGVPLGLASVREFPDGETFIKLEEDIRGRDIFVIQSICHKPNAYLVELLIYLDCIRRASAQRVTAVLPYYGYARQDRKDEGRVPITAKLVANLITAAGADRVLCMDLHAAQIQGFFDIPVDHLSAAPVFIEHFGRMRDDLKDLVLVSPDVGNVKVANMYADLLHAELAIIDKRRQSGTTVASKNLIGDVEGRAVLMVDDMISTAGTICEAAKLVRERGARDIIVAATHAVLIGPALERLEQAPIKQVVVTDTIPDGRRLDPIRDKLKLLTVAKLLGEAVHRIHHDLSVSALFRKAGETKR